jgi:hypothetical protein
MASNDRFYQLAFRDRPVLMGDIGSLLKIEGLIVGGGGARAMLLLPSAGVNGDLEDVPLYELSLEEWSDYISRSDVPEIMGPEKVFLRKARYEISGATQQKIWVADDCMCMYCRRAMGEVQLTIDHFIPIELGGANDPSNYLSACRKCNKDKGASDPKVWCGPQKYLELEHYLKCRKVQ